MTLFTIVSSLFIVVCFLARQDSRDHLQQCRIPGRIDLVEDQDSQPERDYTHGNQAVAK
jgi:hypothetical protein